MRVRPFSYTDDAYREAVAIHNAIDPENPHAVADWKHWDTNREPQHLFHRYVAERQGQVVAIGAYGHTPWSHQPDKFFVHLMVHPNVQNRGIGSAFYNYINNRLTRLRPAKLVAHTRENRPQAIHFLETRGFRQVMREEMSRLDSARFDKTRFSEKVARVCASGIQIKTLAELMVEDPAWKQKTYDLEWECLQDVPSVDGFTRRSLETFEKQTLENPSLLPDAWFVAVDGDSYVGLSVLWRNLATDQVLQTGLTGVVPSHRRRGIATAMKVQAIQYAQAHGNAAIDTENEENNPMFQLNLALGFKPQPAFLDYQKEIGSAHQQHFDRASQSPSPV
jgi:GNAT superfamily N-acetyltransferase